MGVLIHNCSLESQRMAGRYITENKRAKEERRRLFESDVHDLDIFIGLVRLGMGLGVADLLHHVHSPHHTPKHSVLVVQPWLHEVGHMTRRDGTASDVHAYTHILTHSCKCTHTHQHVHKHTHNSQSG